MAIGRTNTGGGGGSSFAFIVATYPSGSTCTCTNGTKTLKAKDTSGSFVFHIPSKGTWTVSCTNGTNTKSTSVSITTEGQRNAVTLSYSRLPAGYQEVAYLQSSGTQYIDTGIAGNTFTSTAKVEAKARWTELNGAILGATADQAWDGALVVKTTNSQFHLSSEDNDLYGGTPKTGTDYTLVANFTKSGNCNLSVGGSQVLSGNCSGGVTSNKIYAFCRNVNGTAESKLKGRIYYLKITINGSLKRNFVPCYRTSDSVAGFYDLVGKAFFTNRGSGTFTVGADV